MTRWHSRSAGGVLLVVAVMVGVAAIVLTWVSPLVGSQPPVAASTPFAPGYYADVPCRPDTFAHVHHPSRLLVVSPCATVTGIVESVDWQPADGDWRVELVLDPPFRQYLPDAGQLLGVEVIPPDVATVALPKRGDRIAASGAWVHNRNRSGAPELHPAWSIQQLDQSSHSRVQASMPAGELAVNVQVDAPTQVPVGDTFTISATVTEGGPSPVPVSLAHLWLEVLPMRGSGVQWKAAASNSLGVATFEIVALYRPGPYELFLYVERQGRVKSLVRHLEVVT